jgi:sphingomyelin phosphodiesterase acid-like 3
MSTNNRFSGSRRILWVFMVLVLLSLPGMGCSGSSQNPNLRVGWISDFHFNPFFDSTIVTQLASATPDQWDTILAASPAHAAMPVTGEDTNRCLLESALSALREDVAEPTFVVFTGDFLTHHFKEQYAALA